jgi:hypothetical protein
MIMNKGYAVFKDGTQASKFHPHIESALVEAFELGALVSHGADFIGDYEGIRLSDGFEIRKIS